jgi:hypothetical protein
LGAVREPIQAVLDNLTDEHREGVVTYLEGSTAVDREATAQLRGRP